MGLWFWVSNNEKLAKLHVGLKRNQKVRVTNYLFKPLAISCYGCVAADRSSLI